MAKNKNTIYIIAGLILVAGLVYYFFFRKKNDGTERSIGSTSTPDVETEVKEHVATSTIVAKSGSKTTVKGTGSTSGTKLLKPIIVTKAPTKTGAVKLDIGAGMV